MARITVAHVDGPMYRVTIDERGSQTFHDVRVTDEDVTRYAPGVPAQRLIEASFEFLLEREPKESILSRFHLPVIERYFPEYPRTIRARL